MVKKTNHNIEKADKVSLPSISLIPEWIISTKTQVAPHVVEFKELFAIRKEILSMTLLWTFNCYHVDVRRGQFLINGGRRIRIDDMQQDIEILYARRNRTTIALNTVADNGGAVHEVSYLLGLQDTTCDEKREVMIHISPDGNEWYWRDRR